MEANKLSQIEKKMDMSLDDLIKLNRSGGRRQAGKGKAAGGAKGGQKGAGPKTAPKSTAKAGIAGKRQAIQQKKAAKATTATAAGGKGVRVSVKKAGGGSIGRAQGVTKGGKRTVGQLKQTMAQKILNKARGKPAAPKKLLATKQAPKQLTQKKRAPITSGQSAPTLALSKSLDQTMKERRQQQQQQQAAKKRKQQQQKQQQRQVPAGNKQGGRQGKVQGGRQPQQQLHTVQRGGVQKRGGRGAGRQQPQPQRRVPVVYQQRAPARPAPFRGQQRQQQQFPRQQQQFPRQQQQFPRQQQQFPRQQNLPRQQTFPRQQGPRHVISHRPPSMRLPPAQYVDDSLPPARYVDDNPYGQQVYGDYRQPRQQADVVAQLPQHLQREALAALRLRRLEEEVQKAERRAAIHRQQEMHAVNKQPRAANAAGQLAGEQPSRAQGHLAGLSHGGMGASGARAGGVAPRGLAAPRGGYSMDVAYDF